MVSNNELNQYTAISNGTTQTPVFDADGNLLSYNGWTYAWNAENRLIRATNSLYVIEYAYDHMGRMVAKTRDDVTTTYLWDDYNMVSEVRRQTTEDSTNYFVWGLDLSGTLQGAGGVGGLLAQFQLSSLIPQPSRGYATYDANGNIADYIDESGAITAHREYDAFGNTISSYGATTNFTHWFSTKPWCEVTGLSEYEYRKYSPELGRWLSIEPLLDPSMSILANTVVHIEDVVVMVAVNQFIHGNNSLLDHYDILGLWVEVDESLKGSRIRDKKTGRIAPREQLRQQAKGTEKVCNEICDFPKLKFAGEAISTYSKLDDIVENMMAGGIIVTFVECNKLYARCINATIEIGTISAECSDELRDKFCDAAQKCFEAAGKAAETISPAGSDE